MEHIYLISFTSTQLPIMAMSTAIGDDLLFSSHETANHEKDPMKPILSRSPSPTITHSQVTEQNAHSMPENAKY